MSEFKDFRTHIRDASNTFNADNTPPPPPFKSSDYEHPSVSQRNGKQLRIYKNKDTNAKWEYVVTDTDDNPLYGYKNNNSDVFKESNTYQFKATGAKPDGDGGTKTKKDNTESSGGGGGPEDAQKSIFPDFSGFPDAVREGIEAGFASLNVGLKDAAATTALLMGTQNSAITRLSEQQIASYLVKSTLGIDAKSLKQRPLDCYRTVLSAHQKGSSCGCILKTDIK